MSNFEEKEYKIFDLFQKQWALVTTGNIENFNSCTVSWGSLGTIWTRPGQSGSAVTVYLYPTRYTCGLLLKNDTFTVSFFPPKYQHILSYLGSRSGQDTDKTKSAPLTPVNMGKSVAYEEADLTFLCRKIYQHQFTKDDIAPDIQAYYQANPNLYSVDQNGEWQPHYVFIGEIIEVNDKR